MNQQEARAHGREQGKAAAENCVVAPEDKREAACPCNPEDPIEFCDECLYQAASAAEQAQRSYSPFEFLAHELNADEERSDGLWEAYEHGVNTGILRGMKPRIVALANRRREAADNLKALLHPGREDGDWGALSVSPLEGLLHLASAAVNDDVTNETWQTVFVSFGYAAGLAERAALWLTEGGPGRKPGLVEALEQAGEELTREALGEVFPRLRLVMGLHEGEYRASTKNTDFTPRGAETYRPGMEMPEVTKRVDMVGPPTPARIAEGVRMMQENLAAEALDAAVTRVAVVGRQAPEDKYLVFGRDTDARPDDPGCGYFKFVDDESEARQLFLDMAPRYNVRHYMAPHLREEGERFPRSRVTLGVRVGRGGYTLWLRLAHEDAVEFDYLWEGPDPDAPEITRGVLALDEYGFNARLGNYAVFRTLEFIDEHGFHVPSDFLAQAAMAAGVQPDPRVRELIRAAADEDPGEDGEDEVLRLAQRPSVKAGQRYDAIQGFDKDKRTARNLSQANFDPADPYHENIKHGAREMASRGLGDAVYQTQYEGGSTVWLHPLHADRPYTVTPPGTVVEEVTAQAPAHECYMGDGYCPMCSPSEDSLEVQGFEARRARRTAELIQGSERCPDCPQPVGDHDNQTGCTHEGCDCQTRRGYDL
jgi:hypothetical protein